MKRVYYSLRNKKLSLACVFPTEIAFNQRILPLLLKWQLFEIELLNFGKKFPRGKEISLSNIDVTQDIDIFLASVRFSSIEKWWTSSTEECIILVSLIINERHFGSASIHYFLVRQEIVRVLFTQSVQRVKTCRAQYNLPTPTKL